MSIYRPGDLLDDYARLDTPKGHPMETLYRLNYDQKSLVNTTPGFRLIEPVVAFTEGSAMTALCLMDAYVEFEAAAMLARAKRGVGAVDGPLVHDGDPDANTGETLMTYRSQGGSFSMRHDILTMTPLVDRAWEACEAEAGDGLVSFDFEFCAAAVRLYFADDWRGDEFVVALAGWLTAEAAAQRTAIARGSAKAGGCAFQ
jgi:hypothetical protein